MNTSTLNKLFGLIIILMALFFSYYPDYYEENLKKNMLAAKEAEMLEWSKELCLKLEEQNIITGIREKSEQEIKNEKEKHKANTLKSRQGIIKRMEFLIDLKKASLKWAGQENIDEYKSDIREHEEMLKDFINESYTSPEVYNYSNVEQLKNYIIQRHYDISFWELKNIDISDFRKMPVEDAKAHLMKNTVFRKIVSSDILEDKTSFSVKTGGEDHKLLTDAFLTNGQKVLFSWEYEYISMRSMKLLKPPESQICMLINRSWGGYHSEISSFYQYMRIFMAVLIIIIPVFYIIVDHRIKANSLNQVDLYPLNKEWTPTIWQVMRGSYVGSAIVYYVIFIIPGIILCAIFIEEIMGYAYSEIYSFLPLAFLSLTAITLVALPVLLKTLKVRRLFRMGEEVECIFTEVFSSRILIAVYNVYSYKFNGEAYSVKEARLDNQKGIIEGETKLTALVDPAKPNRAIIKENFLPNARAIKYTTFDDLYDICLSCFERIEKGKIDKDSGFCPNCYQIMHAFEKDTKILDLYNKGDWNSMDLVCSVCSIKLKFRSGKISNYIYCPKCEWDMALVKKMHVSDS